MRSSRMKSIVLASLLVAMLAAQARALSSTGEMLVKLGGGLVGSLVGAATAVAAIAELTPQFETRAPRVAVVVGSLTVCSGLGGGVGVLAAARWAGFDGSVGGCLLGGLAGGFLSAFTEPIVYTLGASEPVGEFLGFVMLPVLPTVGATLGFSR